MHNIARYVFNCSQCVCTYAVLFLVIVSYELKWLVAMLASYNYLFCTSKLELDKQIAVYDFCVTYILIEVCRSIKPL